MYNKMNAGLIGCGDYLRWEIDEINKSQFFKVKYTYDPKKEKSIGIADKINSVSVDDPDKIFDDPEISIVLIFTPPWIRKEYFRRAVDSGKHIITTKPLAPNLKEAEYLYNMVKNRIQCEVFYARSGNPSVESLKSILSSGEIGNLALYKEDWFHHYPKWNNWATDPEKNGGPFMDAMIHNLNKSKYLIGSQVKSLNFFSENYSQSLKCNDTELMKINFENGAASLLFITWAADLEIYDEKGNDRMHIGIQHIITDKGWYITEEEKGGEHFIKAVKETEKKNWKVNPLKYTRYDQFCTDIQENRSPKLDISEALEDIRIWTEATINKTGASKINP